MSLTPDEEWSWHAFVADWTRDFHIFPMRNDRKLRPNAWPRRFHLWRFWR